VTRRKPCSVLRSGRRLADDKARWLAVDPAVKAAILIPASCSSSSKWKLVFVAAKPRSPENGYISDRIHTYRFGSLLELSRPMCYYPSHVQYCPSEGWLTQRAPLRIWVPLPRLPRPEHPFRKPLGRQGRRRPRWVASWRLNLLGDSY